MASDPRVCIEVSSDRDPPFELTAQGETVRVGSGASADLRLSGSAGIAEEHFTLTPLEEGCDLRLCEGVETPVRVEGFVHNAGVLPWGAEVELGPYRMRLKRERTAPVRRPSFVMIVAPVVMGAAVWMMLSSPDFSAIPPAPPAPALLATEVPECPTGNTFHRAQTDAAAAEAKIHRYPFAPSEGLQAVERYRRAAACYAASGHPEEAEQMNAQASRASVRVTRDFATARYGLSRALARDDWLPARAEIQTMREILSDRPGEYLDWLIILERRVSALASRSGRSTGG